MRQPASLIAMTWTLRLLYLVGLVTVALTWLGEDGLVRSWAEGRAAVRRTLETGGLDAVRAGDIAPPAFVPVAVVMFLVMASLLWVLAAFVRLGYGWARVTTSATLLFMMVATVAGLLTEPPVVFVVLAAVSFAPEMAVLVLMWHRDTSAWMAGTWEPAALDPASTTA